MNNTHSKQQFFSLRFFLFCGCLLVASATLAQGTQQTFGKNRVQYHKDFDEWSEYESENFISYWYGKSRFVGQAAAQIAEADFEEIQRLMEYRMSDKIEIIVYSDLTDLHQSNIGNTEVVTTVGGQTKVAGTKMFVHFDGDHRHLRQQIREGMASVFLNVMIFGDNLQEIVQNAVSLKLPLWFKDGLASYVGQDWTTEMDNEMRDIVQNNRYKNFSKFVEAKPTFAGHTFWYFLSQQYGKANVSNLLYLVRINRDINESFQYVMGTTYQAMAVASMEFYKKRYENETRNMLKTAELEAVKLKNKRKLPITEVKISPNGRQLAYVVNEIGKFRIYVQDVATGKRQMILKSGTRNPFQTPDYSYPLLAWNPDNQRLGIAYEKRDLLKLALYDLNTKKTKTEPFTPDFQRLYSMDFLNSREVVVTATTRGYSDVFTYNTVGRTYRAITNDFYDDLDATVVTLFGRKGILFASNRQENSIKAEKQDSILPLGKLDIFYKDLEDTSKNLVRVSNSIDADERKPMVVDSTFFSYLTDETGIYNRQMGEIKDVYDHTDKIYYFKNALNNDDSFRIHRDSLVGFLDSFKVDSTRLEEVFVKKAFVKNNSNYDKNIVLQHSAPNVGKLVQLTYNNAVPKLNIQQMYPDSAMNPTFTRWWELRKRAKLRIGNKSTTTIQNQQKKDRIEPIVPAPQETPKAATKDTTPKVNIDTYIFQSEFDNAETPKTTTITEKTKEIIKETPKEEKTEEGNDSPSTVIATVDTSTTPRGTILPDGTVISKHVFKSQRIIPYQLKFRTDYITTTADNSLLFGGLDSYSAGVAGNTQYSTPPIGILLKANFKDLLEDYQIEGGIRVPTTFNGYEAFVYFDNNKKQLDKRIAVYHRSLRNSDVDAFGNLLRIRTATTLGQYQVKYPLDMFHSLRAIGTLRFDKDIRLATDTTSLEVPIRPNQRGGIRLEYVFDNSYELSMNLMSGTRYKIYGEVTKKVAIDFVDSFSFQTNKGVMTILGFDARHYERLGKHAIFAVRAAGETTIGSEKILHYLGGMDNSLFAQYDQNTAVPAGNYAFQTLAANMRGFDQNIRNGASYALINAELRVPIFRYFSSRPIQSNFFRNFQLTGFFDVGTAWHGNNPFSPDNPLNTIILDKTDGAGNPIINVKVNYFKDPVVYSYGVGVRTLLFGYFVRVDYGWGVDTRERLRPKLHLALGYDF